MGQAHDSTLATLMTLTPDDVNIAYILCDENISEIDLDLQCDLAVITGATFDAHKIDNFFLIIKTSERRFEKKKE